MNFLNTAPKIRSKRFKQLLREGKATLILQEIDKERDGIPSSSLLSVRRLK